MDKIEMFYLSVPDLTRALAHYRDALGWTELWREGDSTAALGPEGADVSVMLDVSDLPAGPMLTVDDVRAWLGERGDGITVTMAPVEIPGGWWASIEDPFGHPMYVIDQSTEE